MEVSLFFELSLAFALIVLYTAIRYFFGTRMYYRENRYLTIRECLIPLWLIAVHVTSAKVLGYSILPYLLVGGAIISLLLLRFTQRGEAPFNHRQYLHHFMSIVYLVCFGCYLFLQIYRFFVH